MTTPLLPPPPRSAGATPVPRTRDQPGQDLLSSSPTELDNPLFPVQAPQEKSINSKQESPEADVSFGSFTSGKSIPVPGRRPVLDNRHQASQDPLDSSDLLGSMDDGEQQMTVPTAQQHGSLLGGSTGPARHHLSTVPHNIPISSLHSQGLHPTTGLSRTNSLGINSGSFSGGGDHLINEIDAFLKAEQTHHDSPPPAKPSSPKSTSRPPPLSSSPTSSYFHKHGQSPPHRPPRRLSYVHSSAGPSSPPAVSPISSLRHHGNDPVHTHSHKPPNSSVHPYEGLDHLDNLDEFGQWHVGSPSKDRRYESYDWGTPAKEVDNKDAPTLFGQTVDLMRSLSTNDRTKVSGRRSSEQSPDRQKRHSPSQSMGKGSRESKSNMDSVKDGTLPGVYPDPRKAQEVRGTQDKHGIDRSTSNSSQPEDKSNPSPASQSHSLLSEGAKGVSGIVNALGHLAARSAAVKPKSKWRTVMGPSTFSPPTSASKDHWNEYVTSASASGLGSMPGTFPSEHAFDDSVHREDNRTPTSQPIEITHHTPFDLNPAIQNNQPVYIPGTSVPIHPTGSYTPAAPTGAPGYKSAGHVGATSGNRPRNDWAGTKLVGRREGNLKVLDEKVADVLRPNLPARQRLSNKWTLLFSTDQHGGSLSTFYRLIEAYSKKHPQSGNLLIIRDEDDRRFGVYMNEWIKKVEGAYTGSGESWLFKIVDSPEDPRVKLFKWTGRNTYFALCESDFISFGGGDGKYGLWVDKNFQNGSSATCPAYANEVLSEPEGTELEAAKFDCMVLEVWATSG